MAVWLVASVAAAPQLIDYQGYLEDDGSPVTDTLSMTFTIYDASSGGNSKWTETQSSVAVLGGLFSVALGSSAALPDTVFRADDRWLEISIGGSALTPRTRIASTAYAHRVHTVQDALGGTISGDLTAAKGNFGTGNTNTGDYCFVAGHNNTASGDSAVVSGGAGNTASSSGATVGGGLENIADNGFATVGGGKGNRARGAYATVCGGGGAIAADSNAASGSYSFIGGGRENRVSSSFGVITGGRENTVGGDYGTIVGGSVNSVMGQNSAVVSGGANRVSGGYSFIGGGGNDTVSQTYSSIVGGFCNAVRNQFSTVVGGDSCEITGTHCLAAGHRARAIHNGAFVWADRYNAAFASAAADEFSVRATGGVRFYTNGGLTAGVTLSAGGSTWQQVSDSSLKRNIRPVNGPYRSIRATTKPQRLGLLTT